MVASKEAKPASRLRLIYVALIASFVLLLLYQIPMQLEYFESLGESERTADYIDLPWQTNTSKGKNTHKGEDDDGENVTSIANVGSVATQHVEPHFVFHIGIPKSGTTSIQCGLSQLSGNLASKDSYYFIGKPCASVALQNGEMPVKFHYLVLHVNERKMDKTTTSLNATLHRHLHRQDGGRTAGIVLSSEIFGTRKFHAQQSSFDFLKGLLEGYSVRIVVGYRRYFEWFPSMFDQSHYYAPLSESYVDKFRREITASNKTHMTVRATKIWSAQFDDVYVFNMHQDGDLVTNFVCQALPGPPTNVCRELISSESTAHNRVNNPGRELDWLRLIAAARELGWHLTREMWRNTKPLYETFQTTHPVEYQSLLSCLTEDEQEKLLNLSLAYEKELVATATANGNNKHLEELLLPSKLEEHREKFYKHVRKGKFCEFEAVRALSNTSSLFVRYVFPNFATAR